MPKARRQIGRSEQAKLARTLADALSRVGRLQVELFIRQQSGSYPRCRLYSKKPTPESIGLQGRVSSEDGGIKCDLTKSS